MVGAEARQGMRKERVPENIRRNTSAYVSIRQHETGHAQGKSTREHASYTLQSSQNTYLSALDLGPRPKCVKAALANALHDL